MIMKKNKSFINKIASHKIINFYQVQIIMNKIRCVFNKFNDDKKCI
jgi:hypothetical protein